MGGKETRLFQAIDGAYNDAAVQSDDEIKVDCKINPNAVRTKKISFL